MQLVSFLPGLLLGFAVKWWLDQQGSRGAQDDGDEAASEAPSTRGRRRGSAADRLAAAMEPGKTEELRMVLCVNDELKMGKGKIGAQCAHAAVGLAEKLIDASDPLYEAWDECGSAKICLKVPTTEELRALAAAAREAGLETYLVQDAGRTQIAAGSRTVLAIGPAPKAVLDQLTGHLKLL